MSLAGPDGSNGVGRKRRHPNTTAPAPSDETTRWTTPRDIIAEQMDARVRKYWRRTMALAAVVICIQVATSVAW